MQFFRLPQQRGGESLLAIGSGVQAWAKALRSLWFDGLPSAASDKSEYSAQAIVATMYIPTVDHVTM